MEEKLDIMLDMYSDKSLEEWMASLSTAALSKEATKKAGRWIKVSISCSTQSTFLESISQDEDKEYENAPKKNKNFEAKGGRSKEFISNKV